MISTDICNADMRPFHICHHQLLRSRANPPANVNELRQALIQDWNNITQAETNTVVVNSR